VDSALAASMFVNRARILVAQQRHELAEQELARALELDPNDAAAYDLLAVCRSVAGDHRAAHELARRTIELAPTSPDGHLRYAWTILRDGKFIAPRRAWWDIPLSRADRPRRRLMAVRRLVAVRLDPAQPYAWFMLASTWLQLENPRRALEAATRGLQLAPDDVELLDLRAVALAAMGKTRQAAEVTRDALAVDPEHVTSLHLRGVLLLERGEYREAVECLASAVRSDPHDEDARAALAEAMQTQHPMFRWAYRLQAPFARRGFFTAGNLLMAMIGGVIAAAFIAAAAGLSQPTYGKLAAFAVLAPAGLLWLRMAARFVLTLHPQGRHLLPLDQRIASHFAVYLPAAVLFLELSAALGLGVMGLIALAAVLPLAVATAQARRDRRKWFLIYAAAFVVSLTTVVFLLPRSEPPGPVLASIFLGVCAGAAAPYVVSRWLERQSRCAAFA